MKRGPIEATTEQGKNVSLPKIIQAKNLSVGRSEFAYSKIVALTNSRKIEIRFGHRNLKIGNSAKFSNFIRLQWA